MKERILSGVLLLLFLAAAVVFNSTFPFALNLVVGIISALAIHELVKAMGLHRNWFITAPAVITATVIPLVYEWDLVFFIYCAFTAAIFLAMIRHFNKVTFKEIAVVYSMVVLIPQALSTLVALRTLGKDHGMFYVLIAILSAWISDAGAYFAGTFWGKRKLCPNISPKKTVEGFIGGICLNIIAMILFGILFQNVIYSTEEKIVSYMVLIVIGIVGALVSVLGDLSFSLIKRSCHIKDFGQVIPGHGGILDRFDSVIFTAPFVYIIVYFFPIVLNG